MSDLFDACVIFLGVSECRGTPAVRPDGETVAAPARQGCCGGCGARMSPGSAPRSGGWRRRRRPIAGGRRSQRGCAPRPGARGIALAAARADRSSAGEAPEETVGWRGLLGWVHGGPRDPRGDRPEPCPSDLDAPPADRESQASPAAPGTVAATGEHLPAAREGPACPAVRVSSGRTADRGT